MKHSEQGALRRMTDRLYGGLNMSWIAVIAFAVGAAVLTAVFLIVPLFKNSSLERMGVTLEAWIFFAVILMANCKKPLESACKTFVFFLVSQPLIYLLQVPFSSLGWGLFGYYKYWFIWTLATFPMAFVGWYIRKKNWLSLLILAPVLCFLTVEYVSAFQTAARAFPRLIVTALFCLGQVLLYLFVFTKNAAQKLLGFLLPLAAALVIAFVRPQTAINSTQFLPDEPVLTDAAVAVAEEGGGAAVSVERTGQDSMVRIQAERFGETAFEIRDGARVYRYTLEIYEDGGGATQIRITPRE